MVARKTPEIAVDAMPASLHTNDRVRDKGT
jgi:hypothetical protein